jgi:hypothetical protein
VGEEITQAVEAVEGVGEALAVAEAAVVPRPDHFWFFRKNDELCCRMIIEIWRLSMSWNFDAVDKKILKFSFKKISDLIRLA